MALHLDKPPPGWYRTDKGSNAMFHHLFDFARNGYMIGGIGNNSKVGPVQDGSLFVCYIWLTLGFLSPHLERSQYTVVWKFSL